MLGFLALLASAAAYKPHSLLRWRRRALATRLRATRSLALPLELDDWAPARYASPMEFGEAAEHAARALRVPAALRDVANPYGMHSHLAMTLFGAAAASERTFFSSPARASLSPPPAGFAAYPALTSALTTLPPPNASEGGFFFSLMSIVFGTLTASTISDAGDRLKALRAAAVEEATLLLTLTKRLEGLRYCDADEGLAAPEAVFATCASAAWAHTSDLIDGTRDDELAALASGDDEVVAILETLVASQAMWDGGRGPSAAAHVDAAERLVEARGKRLSLESASIPRQQYDVLHALSAVLVVAYAYLTLDKAPPPHALGAFLGADGVHFDGSIGVRVLFSFIVGALGVFNRLAGDLNRTGAASRDCFV